MAVDPAANSAVATESRAGGPPKNPTPWDGAPTGTGNIGIDFTGQAKGRREQGKRIFLSGGREARSSARFCQGLQDTQAVAVTACWLPNDDTALLCHNQSDWVSLLE